MNIPLGGLILKPIDGGRRTKCTFIIEGGLAGSVPRYITKQAIGIQSYTLGTLRKQLPDILKKYGEEYKNRPVIEQQKDLHLYE
mmetsp:Transcript_15954/g.24706  ORF Transcript_15954/g.24706 Transcript_15954/m.24706 type:complete len:84 (+) Transcript_15954:2025-2276(+)